MNCIGYEEFEKKCTNQPIPKDDFHSGYWCDRCENLRRETISKQMEDILKKFGKRVNK